MISNVNKTNHAKYQFMLGYLVCYVFIVFSNYHSIPPSFDSYQLHLFHNNFIWFILTSFNPYQLHLIHTNFIWFIPTSFDSYQLRLIHTNFIWFVFFILYSSRYSSSKRVTTFIPTSFNSYQLHLIHTSFIWFTPTSFDSYQLRLIHTNFIWFVLFILYSSRYSSSKRVTTFISLDSS